MAGKNSGDNINMTEHKILEERIEHLNGSFTDLKGEVKSTQRKHGESLDSIQKSLQSLVVLEKNAIDIKEGMGIMRTEHLDGINRVHVRIDESMKASIDQGTIFTEHLLAMKSELNDVNVVTVENKTKIEGLQWLQRIVTGSAVTAVIAAIVSGAYFLIN